MSCVARSSLAGCCVPVAPRRGQRCSSRRDGGSPSAGDGTIASVVTRRGRAGASFIYSSSRRTNGTQSKGGPAGRLLVSLHAAGGEVTEVADKGGAAGRLRDLCMNLTTTQKDIGVTSLQEGLDKLDAYLKMNEGTKAAVDEKAAVDLVRQMKKAGLARGFGGAKQVPKKNYTLEDLRLNKIFSEKMLSPDDKTLNKISDRFSLAALLGLGALSYGLHWGSSQLLSSVVGLLFFQGFVFVADQVAAGGGVSALVLDTAGRAVSPTYKQRVAAHEAGHFLIAYLLGLLPQAYTLSSLEAYQRYKAFNVQAGTVFCDQEFQAEVASGKLTGGTLGRYTCVALAGVATEYLQYGEAEGGLGDVMQLDGLLKALNFTQAKADGEIRWAVLNTITLLRRYEDVHKKLAAAMLEGASVGRAIAVIEANLPDTGLNTETESDAETDTAEGAEGANK